MAHKQSVGLEHRQPAKLAGNGFVKSFNRRLLDNCLNQYIFASLAEARSILDEWRQDYNCNRPRDALGRQSPMTYRATHQPSNQAEIINLSVVSGMRYGQWGLNFKTSGKRSVTSSYRNSQSFGFLYPFSRTAMVESLFIWIMKCLPKMLGWIFENFHPSIIEPSQQLELS